MKYFDKFVKIATAAEQGALAKAWDYVTRNPRTFGALGGGSLGAGIGAMVSDDSLTGALAGGALGAGTGALAGGLSTQAGRQALLNALNTQTAGWKDYAALAGMGAGIGAGTGAMIDDDALRGALIGGGAGAAVGGLSPVVKTKVIDAIRAKMKKS